MKAIVPGMLIAFSALAFAAPEVRYEPNERITFKVEPKARAEAVEVLDQPPVRSRVLIGRLAVRADDSATEQELIALARAKAAEAGADFVLIGDIREGLRGRRGPRGAASGGGLARRGGSISNVQTLYAMVGVYPKATWGLEFMPFDQAWGRYFVRGFRERSQAAAAGIELGDQILAVDGIAYNDERLGNHMFALAPGQVVKLQIRRGESTLTVDLPLVAND